MRFPPLRYTLPSFPDAAILYRVTMQDRPALLEFAALVSRPESDVAMVIDRESQMVKLIADALVAVDFGGEVEHLPESPELRVEWLMANFPPRAAQEAFAGILAGRVDEAYEKK